MQKNKNFMINIEESDFTVKQDKFGNLQLKFVKKTIFEKGEYINIYLDHLEVKEGDKSNSSQG